MEGLRQKRTLFTAAAFMLMMVTAGCGSQEAEQKDEHKGHDSGMASEAIQVEIEIETSPAKVNEEIVFEAIVTQGGEPVEDAKEVEFEFEREGEEETEKVMVEHQENGIYRLEKSFTEEGLYTIITHVTARDMHSMPKETFEITP